MDCLMMLNLTGCWTYIYTQNDESSSSESSGDALYDLQSKTAIIVLWNRQYSRTTETPVLQTSSCDLATAAVFPTLLVLQL